MAWGRSCRCRAYVILFFLYIFFSHSRALGVIFPIFHVCENNLVCLQPAMNIEDRTHGRIQGGGGGSEMYKSGLLIYRYIRYIYIYIYIYKV